jgi:rhamnosyltransferase subunit B
VFSVSSVVIPDGGCALKILLTPIGSHGDVHPFVGLGMELKQRGHEVIVLANEHFRNLIERAELPFVEFGTAAQYQEALSDPLVWHPTEGLKVILKFTSQAIRPLYDLIAERYLPGETVVVHSPLAVGARLAQEKLGVPAVTVHLAPSSLRSLQLPLNLANLPLPRWTPSFVKRSLFWAADRFVIGPAFDVPLNAVRAELGLPPIARSMKEWWNSPQRIIALFPEWFGTMGTDWPAQTRLCTFPLFDERGLIELPSELEAFLNAGDAPIIFTPGSAMQHGRAFFDAAVKACQTLGKRAILLTMHADHVPSGLPDSIRRFTYIPFSQVFPHSAVVVHHGGIGTTAQALAAGVPQLIMPMAYDQPDNAGRLKQLGVGSDLSVKRFTATNVANELRRLLLPEVRQRCQEVATRLVNTMPFERACMLIEEACPTDAMSCNLSTPGI